RHFTEGTSDTLPSIVIAGVGSLINGFLNYALIFGKFGFPDMGVAGAGHATSAVHWMITLTMLLYIYWRRSYQKYDFFKVISLDWKKFWDVLVLGIPMGGAILC